MKDSDYVMHLWNEIEMRRKEKEARNKKMMQNKKSGADSDGKNGKEMMQNKKSGVDNDGKRKKDQCGSVEKTVLDKEQQKDIYAAKPGATTDNVNDNAGIDVSSGPKTVHKLAVEPAKEDVATSHHEQNDIVQSPSQAKRQKLANEDVGISDQQNDVAQEKWQKME